jgi:hypothetical protein
MIHTNNYETLFTRYTIPVEKNNGSIPQTLKDLQHLGAIAITQDQKPHTFIHLLFNLVQKIHAFIFRRNKNSTAETAFCHGMIITGKSAKGDKPNNLLIAHAVFNGIKTADSNYLNIPSNDVTELVIYLPKDENLRKLLITHAKQTAFTPEKFLPEGETKKEHVGFSYLNMIRSVANNLRKRTQIKKVSECSKQALAYAVADLIKGNQFLDKKGRIQKFFCMSYAMTVLQSSMMINAMPDQTKASLQILSREKVANYVLERINKKSEDSVSRVYHENKICRLNGSFIMSSYAGKTLNKFSERAPVPTGPLRTAVPMKEDVVIDTQ